MISESNLIRQGYVTLASFAGAGFSKLIESKFINAYGFDFFSPIALFAVSRAAGLNRKLSALSSFIIPSVLEGSQYVGSFEGVYDPKDFMAYGIGTATALGLDLCLDSRRESENSLEEVAEIS